MTISTTISTLQQIQKNHSDFDLYFDDITKSIQEEMHLHNVYTDSVLTSLQNEITALKTRQDSITETLNNRLATITTLRKAMQDMTKPLNIPEPNPYREGTLPGELILIDDSLPKQKARVGFFKK